MRIYRGGVVGLLVVLSVLAWRIDNRLERILRNIPSHLEVRDVEHAVDNVECAIRSR